MLDHGEEEKKRPFVLEISDKQDWQIAAVASIGLICPWNSSTIEEKLIQYIDNDGKFVRAGASLGIGICSAGIND